MRIAHLSVLAAGALIASGLPGHAQNATGAAEPGRSLMLSDQGGQPRAKAVSLETAGADDGDDSVETIAESQPSAPPEEGGVTLILRSFATPPPEHGDGLDPDTVRPASAFLLDGISASLLRDGDAPAR